MTLSVLVKTGNLNKWADGNPKERNKEVNANVQFVSLYLALRAEDFGYDAGNFKHV